MKRIILLVILLLVVTGCQAEYNINYFDDKIQESLNVTGHVEEYIEDESFKDKVNDYYNNSYLLVNFNVQPGNHSKDEVLKHFDIYNTKLFEKGNYCGINFNYSFNKSEDFINSSIVYTLYDKISLNEYGISTNGVKNIFNNYPYLDKISIVFDTDKSIINTNSDEEKDGKYYWYIDRENYKSKKINISFENKNEEIITEDNKLSSSVIKYILLGVLIIVLIFVVIIYEKVRKSNN